MSNFARFTRRVPSFNTRGESSARDISPGMGSIGRSGVQPSTTTQVDTRSEEYTPQSHIQLPIHVQKLSPPFRTVPIFLCITPLDHYLESLFTPEKFHSPPWVWEKLNEHYKPRVRNSNKLSILLRLLAL